LRWRPRSRASKNLAKSTGSTEANSSHGSGNLTDKEATSKKRWFDKIKYLPFGAIIGGCIALYVARPELEPQNVFITCSSICDDPMQIRPPENAQDNGATISVVIENTGKMGTVILHHNLTTRGLDPQFSPKDVDFSEAAGPNDGIAVPLGAQTPLTLKKSINEVIIHDVRHGSHQGSTIGPIVSDKLYLYGHVKYRGAFYLPTTTTFCFEYAPPKKGLPEGWGVCSFSSQ
jgi:hypothetical protein